MRLELSPSLFPVILIMLIILAFAKFIVSISGVLLDLFSLLKILGVLACFVQSDIVEGIQALIIAFMRSS